MSHEESLEARQSNEFEALQVRVCYSRILKYLIGLLLGYIWGRAERLAKEGSMEQVEPLEPIDNVDAAARQFRERRGLRESRLAYNLLGKIP